MSGWVWFVIGYAVGVLVECLIFLLSIDRYYVGRLREDRSIPEEPYYFMEIDSGRFERLKKNRFALLRIARENYMDIGNKG